MTFEPARAYLPRRFWRAHPPDATSLPRSFAVLIVAYQNPSLLRECLASVDLHLGEADVLVWDNSGSPSAEMDEVINAYPSVKWYLGSANIGFAAAVNALAREVTGDDILLLNPDAVLHGSLSGTIGALRKPDVAAAAPLVIEGGRTSNRSRPWDVAHREQSIVRGLVSKAGYSNQFRGRSWSELYLTPPTLVDGYLTGACLAISRDAWDRIGPFDEEFFLYGEEADWQRRARAAGWSLVLVDELGIAHTGHGTVANDPVAAMRSRDLLRSNIALNLELERGGRAANLYLAGTSLLDRVQRSARRDRSARRRPAGSHPSVILTTNKLVPGRIARQLVNVASELDSRGYEVVIACMHRLGPLVADIPTSIRVVRQPWWAPALDVGQGRSFIISGDTKSEMRFAALWRASGRDRRWLIAACYFDARTPSRYRGFFSIRGRSDGMVPPPPDPRQAQPLCDRPLNLAAEAESLADVFETAISSITE